MNDIELMGKRIKARRDALGLTLQQVADEIGVAKSTMQRYETAFIQDVKLPVIAAIADVLRVSPEWLVGKTDDPTPMSVSNVLRVPVLGTVRAGLPAEAVQEVLDYEEVLPEMAEGANLFGLKIKGDSMEPRICEGDVVIVREQEDAENGDTVVAIVNGDEATVKKLKKRPEGLLLIPMNPSYEPMFFSREEIERLPVRIIGKVIELRGKF